MAFLDAVLPALVAVGLLYGLCAFYGIEFKGFFVVLAISAALGVAGLKALFFLVAFATT